MYFLKIPKKNQENYFYKILRKKVSQGKIPKSKKCLSGVALKLKNLENLRKLEVCENL